MLKVGLVLHRQYVTVNLEIRDGLLIVQTNTLPHALGAANLLGHQVALVDEMLADDRFGVVGYGCRNRRRGHLLGLWRHGCRRGIGESGGGKSKGCGGNGGKNGHAHDIPPELDAMLGLHLPSRKRDGAGLTAT